MSDSSLNSVVNASMKDSPQGITKVQYDGDINGVSYDNNSTTSTESQ